MMMLIPMIILVVGGIGYTIYMKNRFSAAQSEVNIDMDQERQNFSQYRDELLAGDYKFLQDVVGAPVESFTMVTKPQSMGQKVAKEAVNYLKRSAARRFTYQRIQTLPDSYFGALSGDDLHIVRYDQNSNLKEHLVFGPDRLSTAKVEDQGKAKTGAIVFQEAASAGQPNVSLITFNIDGKPMSFEIYDRIPPLVTGTNMLNPKIMIASRAKEEVVGERLLQDLEAKYPNLKATQPAKQLAEA